MVLMQTNIIYNEDCLVGMDNLPDESVHAIITDPPYNISRESNYGTMFKSDIDFGEWDKGFDQKAWVGKTYRLLKPGGALFIFNDWKNLGEIARHGEGLGYEIKTMVRWRKDNPVPRNRDRKYVVDFEVAVWLVKPGKWTYNRKGAGFDRCEYCYPITSEEERLGHPTQKPVALFKDIIERHTQKGDIVLDPFMGSGTTAVACLSTGRRYIGFEIDGAYWEIAQRRVAPPPLFPDFDEGR